MKMSSNLLKRIKFITLAGMFGLASACSGDKAPADEELDVSGEAAPSEDEAAIESEPAPETTKKVKKGKKSGKKGGKKKTSSKKPKK